MVLRTTVLSKGVTAFRSGPQSSLTLATAASRANRIVVTLYTNTNTIRPRWIGAPHGGQTHHPTWAKKRKLNPDPGPSVTTLDADSMSPEKYNPSSSEMGCAPSTSGYVWMNAIPFSPCVPPSHSGCVLR